MKKLLAVLLGLVVVSGAFAQLTINGTMRTRATYSAKEAVTNGDTGTVGLDERFRLAFSGKDADGNYGFSMRLVKVADFEVNGTAQPFGDTTFDWAFGWAKFAGGMFKVTAGFLDDTSYAFTQNEANSQMGNIDIFEYEADAFLFQVYPMAGLDIGLYYAPDVGKNKPKGHEFTVGATYSVEKMVNVKTGWTFGDSTTPADKYSFGAPITAGALKPTGHLGAEYVGMDNLSAVVGYKMGYDSVGDKATSGVYTIDGYSMDKLFVELAGQMDFSPSTYYAELNVEYTDTAYAVRAFAAYDKDLGKLAKGPDGTANKMKIGAEVNVPVGTKGTALNIGANYRDKSGVQVPFYLTVAY